MFFLDTNFSDHLLSIEKGMHKEMNTFLLQEMQVSELLTSVCI